MGKCDQKFIDRCKKSKGAKAHPYYNETKDMCMCGTKNTKVVKNKKGNFSLETDYHSPSKPTLVDKRVIDVKQKHIKAK